MKKLTQSLRAWCCLLIGIVLVAMSATPATAAESSGSEAFQRLQEEAPSLNPDVLRMALEATECANVAGKGELDLLSVIDYSLPSTARRLWVFDRSSQKLLFHELVAHGVNTGENFATRFSNRSGSRQSSLGLFLTDRTYVGRNGYSLKLHGLEEDINHLALDRTIVIHGAWYVSDQFKNEHGRLGRSWGCPALDKKVARPLIDTIKDGSLLFVYYPDRDWLTSSAFLNGCDAG